MQGLAGGVKAPTVNAQAVRAPKRAVNLELRRRHALRSPSSPAGTLAMLMLAVALRSWGQVPALMSYQGHLAVNGISFTGPGQFKFALVSADGSHLYWQNAADANNDGQPDTNVLVNLSAGLFSLFLGDTNLTGMGVLPISVFTNGPLSLRIWFNDGSHGFQQLSPDQHLASAPYAMMSANVPDGAISPAKLASNTVSSVNAALAGRLDAVTAEVTVLSNQFSSFSNVSGTLTFIGMTAASMDPQDPALGANGFRPFTSLSPPAWITGSTAGAPSPRSSQTGVWTGQQLLIWGGSLGVAAGDSGSGASYRPDLDQWQPISTVNAPAPRSQHSAIWTGLELIVWGGFSSGNYLNTGARLNLTNTPWNSLPATTAPSARAAHVAVWTGSRMVVWGGRNGNGLLNDGALYDPVADRWNVLSLPNAPSARFGATAIWAGDRVIIWGGQNEQGWLNSGAQLLCDTNGIPTAWVALSTVGAPVGRTGHSAVWTGQRMLVWGGQGAQPYLADGAAYTPTNDTWAPVASANAPSARFAHSAVWTGQQMLIFGGETSTGTVGDGAAYDPSNGRWWALTSLGNPLARSGATAVWSGSELLLFGGLSNGAPLASLQRLNPQPTWYLYRKQ